jgi:PAS domain-containing protein
MQGGHERGSILRIGDSKMKGLRTRSRLAVLVWPFVAAVLAQAAVAALSLHMLSAVRAYVGGESLWSKGQKDAIYFLDRYVQTGDETYYRAFRLAIRAPLGDRAARLALDVPPVDVSAAKRGFRRGGNHQSDVSGLIWLFQNFRNVSYLDASIRLWAEADPLILQLQSLGRQIRREISQGTDTPARIDAWQAKIYDINLKITPLTTAFARSLGEGSRAIKDMLLFVNLGTAALLIALAVWCTRKLMRQHHAAEAALDAERQRAQITLSSIGESVVTIDAGGLVNYLNPTAERLFAVRAADACGRPLYDLFTLVNKETSKRDWSFLVRIFGGGRAELGPETHKLLRNDGSTVAISLIGAPLH